MARFGTQTLYNSTSTIFTSLWIKHDLPDKSHAVTGHCLGIIIIFNIQKQIWKDKYPSILRKKQDLVWKLMVWNKVLLKISKHVAWFSISLFTSV